MQSKFKVLRIDKDGSSAVIEEERKEIEAVGGVLTGCDCTAEDEIEPHKTPDSCLEI